MSVLRAMNSTPSIPASIIRFTALTPAPPTPTTRRTGWSTTADSTGRRGSSRPKRGFTSRSELGESSMMFSGMSCEKTWRRRSSGERTRRSSSTGCSAAGSGRAEGGAGRSSSRRWSAGSSGSWEWSGAGIGMPPRGSGVCPNSVRSARSRFGSGFFCSGRGSSPSSSVLRKSAASGPSLMLARLPLSIPEDLLCELAVGVRGLAVRVVLEHGHALHGGLREPDRLGDARSEDLVAEVLLEELDRLLGVHRAGVHQGGQDALDLDVGVQVLPDHAQGVLQLDEAAHGQILALHGDDHLVGGRQRVDREQSEGWRSVDADEVVVVLDLPQRLLERALTADLGGHGDLRAGEVDRGAGHVDLAL